MSNPGAFQGSIGPEQFQQIVNKLTGARAFGHLIQMDYDEGPDSPIPANELTDVLLNQWLDASGGLWSIDSAIPRFMIFRNANHNGAVGEPCMIAFFKTKQPSTWTLVNQNYKRLSAHLFN
ncbi:hypothetical protein PtB15_12B190 [Puccinia triticina]|nr:hypothetical protein PtB15_12B190 [Puccinia triticina]